MTEGYTRTHYWRLPGETEEDRLRRLIEVCKEYGAGETPDRAAFWNREVERFKGELEKLRDWS